MRSGRYVEGWMPQTLPAAAWYVLVAFFLLVSAAAGFMDDEEIAVVQKAVGSWGVGERISFWAEQFIGTPYDPDPLGEYVRREAIVADERVDCMYHVFRSVELALSLTPEEAREVALDKRFRTRGRLDGSRVINYEERFAYGEDMIDSGKWGKEMTALIAKTTSAPGTRGKRDAAMIAKKDIPAALEKLQNGDLVFFMKSRGSRSSDEMVGHMGVIKVEAGEVFLVHAGGLKNRGGRVQKVLLASYAETMPFIGIRISRLE